MNFPVMLVPPVSERLRQRLGRASEFFIKASGGRQRAHGTAALIKVPKRENVTKAQARVSSVRKLQ